MSSPLERLNSLPTELARLDLQRCNGASAWVERMLANRPFHTMEDLVTTAEREWEALGEADWLEAFSHHPKIGDVESLRKKFASTAQWAAGEQSSVQQADEETIRQLAAGNAAYEQKFGFIFIICATGKSAAEMLGALQQRLENDRGTELRIAAGEQAKITALRLKKLSSG
ncbi:MAG TPA: 2-oxo-4-hydroxy-4-carboxy-5-ureidoimidazoline decarboxylase [Phycisphaerae bacterium]|nr:2-oxo-4-hydroxy-4-carboxy-5-ureidoimidazoline decarboxylase [Phycisphaerae bacterium]